LFARAFSLWEKVAEGRMRAVHPKTSSPLLQR
jgi:hypothetical protein